MSSDLVEPTDDKVVGARSFEWSPLPPPPKSMLDGLVWPPVAETDPQTEVPWVPELIVANADESGASEVNGDGVDIVDLDGRELESADAEPSPDDVRRLLDPNSAHARSSFAPWSVIDTTELPVIKDRASVVTATAAPAPITLSTTSGIARASAVVSSTDPNIEPSSLIAADVSAWFGSRQVLKRCSLA